MPIDRRLLEAAAQDREKLAPKTASAKTVEEDEKQNREAGSRAEENAAAEKSEKKSRSAGKPSAEERRALDEEYRQILRFKKENDRKKKKLERSGLQPYHARCYAPAILSAVCLLLLLVSRLLPYDRLPQRDNIYLAIVLLQIVAYALPSVFFAKLRGRRAMLLLRVPAPGDLGFTAVMTLFSILACTAMKILLCRVGIYESAYSAYSSSLSFISGADLTTAVYIIVTFAVIPSICQGFLFRGLLLGEYLSDGCGVLVSVTAAVLLSALSGLSAGRLPMLLLSGLLLTVTAVVTRSAFAAIFSELFVSLVDLFGENFVTGIASSDYGTLFSLMTVAAALLTGIWAVGAAEKHYYILSTAKPIPGTYPERDGKAVEVFRDTLLNPVNAASIGIFAAAVILRSFGLI